MGANSPVTATSIVTPPVVSASSGMGGIAVQVTGYGGANVSGMPVTVSGPTTATVNTDSSGCALFGNLTPGTYAVNLYSAAGTYVDEVSGQALTATTADTVSNNTVAAGSIQSLSYTVAPAGTLNYSFVSTSGNPAGVAPGAIGVVAYNATMKANNLRVCTLANGTNCPAVNGADTSFGAADWPQLSSVTQIPAYPLFPFNGSDNYTVYAGTCSANDPGTYSGTDVTATLQPSSTTNVTVTVPAMLIHVWNGTSTSPGSETFNFNTWHLWVKDVGCGLRYYGYKLGGTVPAVSAGQSPEQAVLPLNSNYPTSTTGGILAYPAMPYGKYDVCVDNGSKYWSVSNVTNNNSSGTINLYTGTGGTTGTLSGTSNPC